MDQIQAWPHKTRIIKGTIMAMKKEIEFPGGIVCAYHVASIEVLKQYREMRVNMHHYTAAEYERRAADYLPVPAVAGKSYRIPPEIWTPVYGTGGDLGKIVYDHLAEYEPEYKGAEPA
jgi:hypothetical protein